MPAKPTRKEPSVMAAERKIGWFFRALDALPAVFNGGEKTGEELYDMVVTSGLEHAPNPYVWGGVVREAIKHQIIARTGERRPMKHKASHKRMTDVYRRVRKARRV